MPYLHLPLEHKHSSVPQTMGFTVNYSMYHRATIDAKESQQKPVDTSDHASSAQVLRCNWLSDLMVAEDGHLAIGTVVWEQQLRITITSCNNTTSRSVWINTYSSNATGSIHLKWKYSTSVCQQFFPHEVYTFYNKKKQTVCLIN